MAMTNTTLFLAGDVMTGRGLDQAMQHPGSPTLHEPSVRDARRYRDLCRSSYGCGDLIDDYEGIAGDEEFRGDLGLLYFPVLEPARGRLVGLRMEPTRMHGFSLRRAGRSDADWLAATLSRTSERFGTVVDCDAAGGLMLRM